MKPSLCRLADDLPTGPAWTFEPKLDGFRVIAHRSGSTVTLTGRNGVGSTDCSRTWPNGWRTWAPGHKVHRETVSTPDCLRWARRLQAIAQTGIRYNSSAPFGDPVFDLQRYEEVQAIAAEMLSAATGTSATDIRVLLDGERNDATPKVDVRGVVIVAGEVLLVRERADGKWTLPGGWAEVGESPSRAAEREVHEESGYVVRATKLLACYDRDRHHPPGLFSTYKLFFLCDVVGGGPTESIETAEARFFAKDTLPTLSEARVTTSQLERFFEHIHHPGLHTDFD